MCECVDIKAMFNHMPLQTALVLNSQSAGLRKKGERKRREGERDAGINANDQQHHVKVCKERFIIESKTRGRMGGEESASFTFML